MHKCADRRYDAFGIPFTNPEKIVEVALLYSYGFGAVLHGEMTLYMAQEISPIAWVYQLYALETCREASLESVSELRAILQASRDSDKKEHKEALEYYIA